VSVSNPPTWRPGVDSASVDVVRDFARRGVLAPRVASASVERRRILVSAVYEVAWPVVFNRLTRVLEIRRGHVACSHSVLSLADGCLDHFHDDVESAVEYVLRHAGRPIANLEAWLASRLRAATVDGHRRRRGRMGALQRPRVPRWLAKDLGEDRWLMSLATQVLLWVGVPTTAGSGLWPVSAWAHRRGLATGDWLGSSPATVRREVEEVLAAMRRRPKWYVDHVETPLGRKQAPVVTLVTEDGTNAEPPALPLVEEHELDDERLAGLAADAIYAIQARLGRGEDARTVVVDVIRTMFCSDLGTPALSRAPHRAPDGDEAVLVLLDDPERVARVVEAALGIVVGCRVTVH